MQIQIGQREGELQRQIDKSAALCGIGNAGQGGLGAEGHEAKSCGRVLPPGVLLGQSSANGSAA